MVKVPTKLDRNVKLAREVFQFAFILAVPYENELRGLNRGGSSDYALEVLQRN